MTASTILSCCLGEGKGCDWERGGMERGWRERGEGMEVERGGDEEG